MAGFCPKWFFLYIQVKSFKTIYVNQIQLTCSTFVFVWTVFGDILIKSRRCMVHTNWHDEIRTIISIGMFEKLHPRCWKQDHMFKRNLIIFHLGTGHWCNATSKTSALTTETDTHQWFIVWPSVRLLVRWKGECYSHRFREVMRRDEWLNNDGHRGVIDDQCHTKRQVNTVLWYYPCDILYYPSCHKA